MTIRLVQVRDHLQEVSSLQDFDILEGNTFTGEQAALFMDEPLQQCYRTRRIVDFPYY